MSVSCESKIQKVCYVAAFSQSRDTADTKSDPVRSSRFRNPGKILLVNSGPSAFESVIQIKESGIQVPLTRNPNLAVPRNQNPQPGIQDCLGLPNIGRTKVNQW